MVVEKAWTLSDDNRQVIKENAQKIKDFLTLKKAYNCTEFYNWCEYYDHDFLEYIENFLPFIENERKYISKSDIKNLIHEIDLEIRDIKPYLTVDDFDNVNDLVEFIADKYDGVDLHDMIEKIIEYGNERLINKLLNRW